MGFLTKKGYTSLGNNQAPNSGGGFLFQKGYTSLADIQKAGSNAKKNTPTPTITPTSTSAPQEGGFLSKVTSFLGGLSGKVGEVLKPKSDIKPITLSDDVKINFVEPDKPISTGLSLAGNNATIKNIGGQQLNFGAPPEIRFQKDETLLSPFKTETYLDFAPSTINLLAELQVDPLTLKESPQMTLKDIFKPFWLNPVEQKVRNTFVEGIVDGLSAEADNIRTIFNGQTRSEKVGGALKLIPEAAFPITAFFEAAETIPVVGTVSKLIALPFAVLGDAGMSLAYPVVNSLPVSRQARENILSGTGEILGLALMIGVGGKLSDVPGKVEQNLTKKYGKTDAETIMKKAEDIASNESSNRLSGTKTPDEIVDYVYRNELSSTPDGIKLLQASNEAKASGKLLQIESPKIGGLLEAKTKSTKEVIGEGFTMTNKANPESVAAGRVLNNYRTALDAYNKKPTPRSLQKVQKERETLKAYEQRGIIEKAVPEKQPTAPVDRTVRGVSIKSIGEDIKVYRGTTKGEAGLNVTQPNGITGGVSVSTDRAVAQRFAENKGGKVEELNIPGGATVVNHSDLERLTKYLPASEKAAFNQKFIRENNIDVVKFDIPAGAKGEAEYRIVGEQALNRESVVREKRTPEKKPAEQKSEKKPAAETPKPKPKDVEVPRDQLPVGKGDEKVSKLEARMKGVYGKATKEQIEELGLSTFRQMNRKDTIAESVDWISKHSVDDAIAVITGEKAAPKGILPESLYVALTQMAKGDFGLATKVTSLQASAIGQRLSILAELDPLNPVNIVSEIYRVKAKRFEADHAGKSAAEVSRSYVKKGQARMKPPKLEDWGDFIKEVRC